MLTAVYWATSCGHYKSPKVTYRQKEKIQTGTMIFGISSSEVFHAPVFWFHKFSTENSQKPLKLLQPIILSRTNFLSGPSQTNKRNWMAKSIQMYVYQFSLFGIDSDYHILIISRQQMADALIRNRELLVTFIILNQLGRSKY